MLMGFNGCFANLPCPLLLLPGLRLPQPTALQGPRATTSRGHGKVPVPPPPGRDALGWHSEEPEPEQAPSPRKDAQAGFGLRHFFLIKSKSRQGKTTK